VTASHPARLPRRAFTLIEILVTLGVIVLLIAITLPALRHARESARRASCLANLRSFGVAFTLYRDANRNRLPIAYEIANVSVGRLQPFDALAEHLDAPLPVRGRTGLIGVIAPYKCPSDSVFAPEFGFSYHYWAVDFFRVAPNPDPGTFVARQYDDDHSEPLLIDRHQHYRPIPNITNSAGHALWLDGRAGRPE
jgi:prepilin-type N-terminal cleavage/methylation domain-containing protein